MIYFSLQTWSFTFKKKLFVILSILSMIYPFVKNAFLAFSLKAVILRFNQSRFTCLFKIVNLLHIKDNWLIMGTIVTSSLWIINHLITTFLFHHVSAKRWVAGWPFNIPLMYNIILWNNFLKKTFIVQIWLLGLDGWGLLKNRFN